MHEPLGGEAGKLAAQKAGDFRLVYFQYVGSASLVEPPRANGLANADREAGFGETFFRVCQTDISEDVPAA